MLQGKKPIIMNAKKNRVFVTKPYLPPLEEFMPYLQDIWNSQILTNNGPFHQELEQKLGKYLNVPHVSLFANGTLALLTALQALNIHGEVITTPFSFVATTHSLWWNKIKPVFVDIDPQTCNLNPERIEEAITSRTEAILPVHVYGFPCKVDQIQEIADQHGLKMIYDAAHTMGAKFNGRHLASFGDLSVLSFHATKVFNTFEGGAIVSHTPEMKEHIDNLKNFGFRGETTVVEPGINAKMNEFQAALGLLQLKHLPGLIQERKAIASFYREQLKDIQGIRIPAEKEGLDANYAYFPLFISGKDGKNRDKIYYALKRQDIHPRRYFYPLISHFQPYRDLESAAASNLPVSEKAAAEVLCIPIYPGLEKKVLERICNIIKTELSWQLIPS